MHTLAIEKTDAIGLLYTRVWCAETFPTSPSVGIFLYNCSGSSRWKPSDGSRKTPRLGAVSGPRRYILPDTPKTAHFGKKFTFAGFQTMEIALGFVNSNSSSAVDWRFVVKKCQPSSCDCKQALALKSPIRRPLKNRSRRRSAELLK